MANNKIFTFAENSNHILTDEEYEADAQRKTGNQPGIARGKLVNKALKQACLMAAALAQFGTEQTDQEIHDLMTVNDIKDIITEAVKQIFPNETKIGEIQLKAFSASELPLGWYHANGDKYSTASAVGMALLELSASFKTNWNIVESEGMINLPNMYHTDGRAYFPRAGAIPGVVQDDAIRNITGTFNAMVYGNGQTGSGAILRTGFGTSNQINSGSIHGQAAYTLNISNSVPTAEENRPLNISFLPAIYLGV